MITSFFTGYLAQGVGSFTGFVENTASGYARVPVVFTPLNLGSSALALGVTFPGSATYTVTQRALYDAPTGGNLILYWNLKNPVSVTGAGQDTLNAGALNHFYPALSNNTGAGINATPVTAAANAQVGQTNTGLPVYAGTTVQVVNGTIAYVAATSGGGLAPSNNLADLTNVAIARSNLGLGSAGFPTLRLQTFGDSRAQQMSQFNTLANATAAYPQYAYTDVSALAWLKRLSRGAVSFDLTQGYSGAYQGILKTLVLAAGSGYTAPTFTANGVGTGTVFGTAVLNAQGGIVSVPVTTQGSGWTSLPTSITITDSTGTGASIQGVVGGYGNFGVGGETTTQALARLQLDPSILAAPVDVFLTCIGTNDLTNGISAATTKSNLQTIFNMILAAGKYVCHIIDHPRSVWAGISGGTIINARHQMYDVNRWVYRFQKNYQNANPSAYAKFLIVDAWSEMSDATSATGDPLANWTSDGLHFSRISGYALGYKLWQQLAPILGVNPTAPGTRRITSQADLYDATYNPTGALTSNPMLTGTSGSVNTSGGIVSGSLATGYWFGRNAGNGAGTVAISQETTRTDGYSGVRQVFTASLGSATTNDQFILYMAGQGKQPLASFNLAVGDVVKLEMDIEYGNLANLNQSQLSIQFFDASNNLLQTQFDGSTQGGVGFASATQAMGGIPPMNASVPMTYTTPPIAVPANATQASIGYYFGFLSTGAASSATATIKVGNMVLSKGN